MLFNWFDIIIVAFLVWGYRSGNKSDFVTEFLKLVGAYLTTFIAVHYFYSFGILCGKFMLIPQSYQDGFAFCFIAGVTYGLFFFMAKGWLDLLKFKCPLVLDKWGSIFLSLLKTFILCGLIFLVFVMFLQGAFARGARDSFSGRTALSTTSGKIYEKSFAWFVHPIFKSEEFNQRLFHYIPESKFKIKHLLRR